MKSRVEWKKEKGVGEEEEEEEENQRQRQQQQQTSSKETMLVNVADVLFMLGKRANRRCSKAGSGSGC